MRGYAAMVAMVALMAAAAAAPEAVGAAEKGGRATTVGLKRFGSCGQVVRHGRRHVLRGLARRRMDEGIVDDFLPGGAFGPQDLSSKDAVRPYDDAAPGQALPGIGGEAQGDSGTLDEAGGRQDFSTTNVQEAGVDEPDIVKTDGSTIFALREGVLYAVDARAARPRIIGSLRVGKDTANELLLRGDRALVMSTDYEEERTRLSEIDIADPAAMQTVRTLRSPGLYVSARQSGATARVVLSTPPRASDFRRPAAVRRSRLRDWVPYAAAADRTTGQRVKRKLVACRAVSRPARDSGMGVLTVLTVDMDRGLPAVDADSVMTEAETVYASPKSLYVATERATPGGPITTIHKFDASEGGSTRYRGSGDVLGRLLNQFALSEHRGHLRAATTAGGAFDDDDLRSYVTVLAEHAGKLVRIGRAGDLGPRERIYSVRFVGDIGYVVTFREVDPLYTLDLSRPRRPTVVGELKIRGYSAYLHPIDDDLLLGVGQDATRDGSLLGAQLSLFDVSNLRKPVRLARRTLDDSDSEEVEYDHRAFLFWRPTGLVVLPVEEYGEKPLAGARAFRVRRSEGITEVGRIVHRDGEATHPIRRSLVMGGRLFTFSGLGGEHRTLHSLGSPAMVAFPRASGRP